MANLTPRELAAQFAAMDSEQQAKFFSNLMEIANEQSWQWSAQLKAIAQEDNLTEDAESWIELLNMYVNP